MSISDILSTPQLPPSVNPDRQKMLTLLQQNEALMQYLAQTDKQLLNEFSRKLMAQAAKSAYLAMN